MSLSSLADTLLEAVELKRVTRAGWTRKSIPFPEDVAAHSWGVAWLVTVLLPDDLDRARALTYAVLHDLAEVRVGDITPHDGVTREEKQTREADAMQVLTAPLPPHVLAAWETYEHQRDPESRFVRQLDRLDMAIQAVAYARCHDVDTREFLGSAEKVIVHPRLRELLREVSARHP